VFDDDWCRRRCAHAGGANVQEYAIDRADELAGLEEAARTYDRIGACERRLPKGARMTRDQARLENRLADLIDALSTEQKQTLVARLHELTGAPRLSDEAWDAVEAAEMAARSS
jgi:ABC-type uncharacterized transport system ATPase component